MFNESRDMPNNLDTLVGMAKLVGLPANAAAETIRTSFKDWERGMDASLRSIGTNLRERLGLDASASEEEVYSAFMALDDDDKDNKNNNDTTYGGISATRN